MTGRGDEGDVGLGGAQVEEGLMERRYGSHALYGMRTGKRGEEDETDLVLCTLGI